jgi:hypothetical protein
MAIGLFAHIETFEGSTPCATLGRDLLIDRYTDSSVHEPPYVICLQLCTTLLLLYNSNTKVYNLQLK